MRRSTHPQRRSRTRPCRPKTQGPGPRAKALGITLGEWFSAKGAGTYSCENGVGKVDITFENLVPNGLYTMWHDFAVWPPTDPFLGFYDLPFGARDGSENSFRADAQGRARFARTITPCLQLSGEQCDLRALPSPGTATARPTGRCPESSRPQPTCRCTCRCPRRTGL